MYKRILVAIDGSETSHQALAAAAALARSSDAILQPLYVVNVPMLYYDIAIYNPAITRDAMMEEGALVALEATELMKKDGAKGTPRVVESAGFEDVAQSIIAAADAFGADLLVLGTHGRRGFRRLMLGSVAERTVRLATCQVLLVPSKEAAHHRPAQATADL